LRKIIIAPTTLQDTAPIEYIEATAAAGYDGIGLRVHRSPGLPFHPVVGNAPLIAEMKSRIADAGLDVFDLYSFYLQPDTDVASFAPAMELGASFGAKYATVMGADENWSRQRDNFVKTCDLAAQFGLTCSLEFAVIRPLATLPQTLRLIDEAKRDAGRRGGRMRARGAAAPCARVALSAGDAVDRHDEERRRARGDRCGRARGERRLGLPHRPRHGARLRGRDGGRGRDAFARRGR